MPPPPPTIYLHLKIVICQLFGPRVFGSPNTKSALCFLPYNKKLLKRAKIALKLTSIWKCWSFVTNKHCHAYWHYIWYKYIDHHHHHPHVHQLLQHWQPCDAPGCEHPREEVQVFSLPLLGQSSLWHSCPGQVQVCNICNNDNHHRNRHFRFPIVINEAEPSVHLAVKAHAPNLVQFEGWVHRW